MDGDISRSQGRPSGAAESEIRSNLQPQHRALTSAFLTQSLHRSGQAELPHPALTSGNHAHAAQGIRMTHASGRQPAVVQAPHPVPEQMGVLAASRKGAMPETCLEPKLKQRRAVSRAPGTRSRATPLSSTPVKTSRTLKPLFDVAAAPELTSLQRRRHCTTQYCGS
jgi:hypothetical protein